MLSPHPTWRERLTESLRFWAVVLIICAAVGLVSYAAGRRYVGSRLQEMKLAESAPEIKPMDEELQRPDTAPEAPPEQPVVTLRERQPTARERQEAEERVRGSEPQDGASLHAREQAPQPQLPPEQTASPEAPQADSGTYVVCAGSFANEGNAQAQVNRLVQMGYHPYLTRTERDGKTHTRVNVGQFPTREEAERVAEELRSRGFDAAIYAR